MNSFKKIVSLFLFGMMASPLCSMDSPLGKKYPTSFLGIMTLRQQDPAYHIAKAERENRIAEQEQFYKEEKRTILAENFRRAEKEKIGQGSPNTVAYSPRTPTTPTTPTKSILKTSSDSAFSKPNKKINKKSS